MFLKKLKNEENYLEFKNIINDIRLNEKVREMSNYMQHSTTSCYNHCLHVAYYTYLICKKFNLDYFLLRVLQCFMTSFCMTGMSQEKLTLLKNYMLLLILK